MHGFKQVVCLFFEGGGGRGGGKVKPFTVGYPGSSEGGC